MWKPFVWWFKCVTILGSVLHSRLYIVKMSQCLNTQTITAATCCTTKLTERAFIYKEMQAEEYNRRGNPRFHLTILFFSVCPAVTVSVTAQVKSWWTTSHSTWSPSDRGRLFQTWSRVTWRSFSLTLHLQSRRTGRASSKTLRKSSCQGWVSAVGVVWKYGKEESNLSIFSPGGSLAEPSHACLLPQSDFMALHAWRHAGRCH